MGARGPQPKDSERRQRPKAGETPTTRLAILPRRTVAPAPDDLSDLGKAEWTAFLSSDTGRVVDENALPTLRRLFQMRDQLEHFRALVAEELWIEGSTKQPKLNPLVAEMSSLRTQILALEDRFGMNPRQKAALGVAFGDVAKTLDERNQRAAEQAAELVDDAASLGLATQ